ncbi:hypothetical protein [Thauera sinica]|uniref:Uncharacterized protein n=1 Tax=Thauera sinica TaxID=2665146 RepID=A0ABW1AXQ4_9RHOO|nr:hypothetical protein [Thauera sp. K11]
MSLIDIQAGILRAIAKATSKHPARADEVLARMIDKGDDSITPPLAQRALEALVSSKCVTTAHVQRMKTDKEPWLAIWPTGLPLAPPQPDRPSRLPTRRAVGPHRPPPTPKNQKCRNAGLATAATQIAPRSSRW